MINSIPLNADEKQRYQLDLQAHQIDTILDRHQIEGTVTGGTLQQRIVEFDVQAPLTAGLERVRGLKDSMMAALGVRDVAVTKQGGRWHFQIERTHEPPVPLAALLAGLDDLPPGTAAIGLADGNQPVLLQFGPDTVPHVLVAGELGAGKTTLLRTIATSLALTNRQGDVQLLLMDGGGEYGADGSVSNPLWRPLAYLPHLMTDLVAGTELSAEVLHFLVGEMAYRRKQRVRLPRVIVLIDNAVALLESGGSQVVDDVLRLLQHGSGSGIHLVLATAQPEAAVLDALFLSNLPVRLLGRFSDPAQAGKLVATGESQAEYLRGGGEFIAIAGEQQRYFQAADMSDYDLHWELSRLFSGPRPCLLARPYDTRPAIVTPDPIPFVAQPFERKKGVQWTDSAGTAPKPNSAPKANPTSPILSAEPDDSAGDRS